MKKLIALLLAVLMMFSAANVAFATEIIEDEVTTTAPAETEEETTEPSEDETTEEEPVLGELDWLLDLPFWTVGPAFKFAKIALKLVKVYVKLAMIFGIIDKDDIIGQIEDLIAGSMQGEGETETTEPVETTAAPEVTEPIAA